MSKYYVLSNSKDNRLYYQSAKSDTCMIFESKKFSGRRLAERFILSNNLSENYQVKLVSNTTLKESLDPNDVGSEIQSALDDSKDIIDTTLEFIDMCINSTSMNENNALITNSNIEDLADRLRKVKKYMAGMFFIPSFYDSKSSSTKPEEPSSTPDNDPSSTDTSNSTEGGTVE